MKKLLIVLMIIFCIAPYACAETKSFGVFKQGLDFAIKGMMPQAKAFFDKSVAIDGNSFSQECKIILKEMETKQIDKESGLSYFRGTWALVNKEFPTAFKEYAHFYSKNKTNVIAINSLGLGFLYNGDYKNAAFYFELAVNTDTSYKDAYENVIFTYSQLKNADKVAYYGKRLAALKNISQ